MPMSMWRYPGARMGSVITLVFFAWYAFFGLLSQPHLITNVQVGFQYDGILRHALVRASLLVVADYSIHSVALFSYQQVKLLSAIETSLHFIPMAVAGFSVNVITGYAMGRTSGHMLILLGLIGTVVRVNN